MKILVPTLYPTVGGSTRVLVAAAKALAVEHDVIVRGPFAQASEQTELAFPTYILNSSVAKLRTAPLIIRLIAKEYLNLWQRGFDVIYVHDSPSLAVYGVVAHLIKARLICHVHLRESVLLEDLRKRFAYGSIHISKHCAGSETHVIIPNPLPPLSIRREPKLDELVVAGSISARKNQLLAIDAVAVLLKQGFSGRLRLCGDIIDAGYLGRTRRRAEEMKVEDRVCYDGFVTPQDYLSTASCLLMPSLVENQPLALLEAIAAAVPVVASDIPAHRELAELGCLPSEALAPLTPDAFAGAIVLARTTRNTAKYAARVREIFSTERFSRKLTTFFRTVGSHQLAF